MKSQIQRLSVSLILISLLSWGCSDSAFEPNRTSFFKGRINGESFETNGSLLFCSRFSEVIYTDNITNEVNGFHFEARNCARDQEIEITVPDNLSLGTFLGCRDNPDTDLDFSISFMDEENDHCEDANLEITTIEIKNGFIYIEGFLDAKLQHPGFGEMILSNVHFGVYSEER
ncbi:hypothetical protein [Halocola ammonii]